MPCLYQTGDCSVMMHPSGMIPFFSTLQESKGRKHLTDIQSLQQTRPYVLPYDLNVHEASENICTVEARVAKWHIILCDSIDKI
jgi:hypothetical protein